MNDTTFASISFSNFLDSFRRSAKKCNENNHSQPHSLLELMYRTNGVWIQSYHPMLSPFCMTSKTFTSGAGDSTANHSPSRYELTEKGREQVV